MKPTFEKVQRAPDAVACYLDFSGPVFDCPYHVHPEIEITYIMNSSGRRMVGDHIGEFAPGDLVIIGGGVPHIYINDPAKDAGPRHAQSRSIQFLPDCLGSSFFRLAEMRKIAALIEASRRGLVFGTTTRRKASVELNAVYAASGAERVLRLLHLLNTLAEARDAKPLASLHFHPGAEPRQSARINKAIEHINNHLFERVSLGETAAAACMSPQGFSRLFAQLMGRTLTDFVHELRIGAACQKLVETDATVAEIAFESGFSNLSNFNRQFLRIKKKTPRQYRREFDRVRDHIPHPAMFESHRLGRS